MGRCRSRGDPDYRPLHFGHRYILTVKCVPPPASAGEAYPEDAHDRYYIGVVFIVNVGFADDEHHGVPDPVTGYVFAETGE